MVITSLVLSIALVADAKTGPAPLDVLVLDLVARDVSPEVADEVTDLVALELTKLENVAVVTRRDLKANIEHAVIEQLLGCETEGDCSFDVTKLDAGTRTHIVYGSVAQVGSETTLTLSILDANEGVVAGRSTQLFGGDASRILGAVQAAVFNLVTAVRGGGERAVSLATIEAIRVAQTPKRWDVHGSLGTSLYIDTQSSGLVNTPGLSARLGADYSLDDNWMVGGAFALESVESTRRRPATVISLATGDQASESTILQNQERSEAQVRVFGLLGRLTYRRAYGLVLPFVGVGAGVAYNDVKLGREILEPINPDEQLPTQPGVFDVERSDPRGWSPMFEAGGGVQLMVTRTWALLVDARFWTSLHNLETTRTFVTVGESSREDLPSFYGMALRVGVLFQQ